MSAEALLACGRRPLVFVDLDDTLFQTARKMAEGLPRHTAALDVHGQPNSYMNPVQHSFVAWLLACAEVVPVTARSVEAYSRVCLPFAHGAVCAHGGVLLDAGGKTDERWRTAMAEALDGVQKRLPALSASALAIGRDMGFSLRGWVVSEDGLQLYVVIKQNGADDAVLAVLLDEVRSRGLLEGMHVHRNGNNLAFLPQGLDKARAVREWLRRDRDSQGERPVLGFGDSLSDLTFMSECHFWGTPSNSQLAASMEVTAHD